MSRYRTWRGSQICLAWVARRRVQPALACVLLFSPLYAPSAASATGAPGANAAAIWFETTGGDAWVFDKTLTGGTAYGACDDVLVGVRRGIAAHSPSPFRRPPDAALPNAESKGELLDGHASETRFHTALLNQHFAVTIHLHSGPNRVTATCLNHGVDVGSAAAQRWTVLLRDAPRAWIRTNITQEAVVMDASASVPGQGIPAPVARYEWRARDGNPAPLSLVSAADRLRITTPRNDGTYYITLRVTDTLHRSDESTAAFRVFHGIALKVDTDIQRPEWVDNTILYGIALPLLGKHAFADATQHLSSIVALGATAIWLSPVTGAPTKDFGYATTDPFHVRASFGSETQFRALIAAAHARGLRVVLDFVVNHFSSRHPYFVDARQHGRTSPYYDWFQRDSTGKPAHYFDWTNLENLNYQNPEVRNYITAALTHWLQEYGVDGYRVDAAWTLKERAPQFWPAARRELERVNPDIVLLAEASARDPYYAAHGFDATYDWTDTPGQWAWHDIFGLSDALPQLAALRDALEKSTARSAIAGLPQAPLGRLPAVVHFLNNNDTGQRFLSAHGAGLTRVAAAMLFTLPGIPLVYWGDEVGAVFEPYKSSGPVAWRDSYDLRSLYSRLARLRRHLPALRSTSLEILDPQGAGAVLAYRRHGDAPGEDLVVVLNFGSRPVQAHLPAEPPGAPVATESAPGSIRTEAAPREAEDLMTGVTWQHAVPGGWIHVPAYTAVLLRRSGSSQSAAGGFKQPH